MKNFYHLLANSLIASITNFTVWFALVFYAYLQTQSVLVTGVISGLYLVAIALSGFWFGSLVDHYNKKKLLIASSFLSLIAYASGLAIYLTNSGETFANQTSPVLWLLIVILMFGVVLGGIRNITVPTIVTIIAPVDQRDRANGLVGTTSGISFLITSVISGLLVGSSGLYWVLILSLIATSISIFDLSFISIHEIPQVKSSDQSAPKNMDVRGTIKLIMSIPGFMALIAFTTFNNFLGGVFMALMDAYGLSLVSVEIWGLIWGGLSTGFIIGGLLISKFGLGKNPLYTLFAANLVIWTVSSLFTLQSSIVLLVIGMFIYLTIVPFIEAAEQTIIQKVVPQERQGRVFGFAHSVEQAASPLTAFFIGPLTQMVFIPFMTTGAGIDLIGSWFGTGADRGIALVFTLTGVLGLLITILARRSQATHQLAKAYIDHPGN